MVKSAITTLCWSLQKNPLCRGYSCHLLSPYTHLFFCLLRILLSIPFPSLLQLFHIFPLFRFLVLKVFRSFDLFSFSCYLLFLFIFFFFFLLDWCICWKYREQSEKNNLSPENQFVRQCRVNLESFEAAVLEPCAQRPPKILFFFKFARFFQVKITDCSMFSCFWSWARGLQVRSFRVPKILNSSLVYDFK